MSIKETFRQYIGCVPNGAQVKYLVSRYGSEQAFHTYITNAIMQGREYLIDRMLDAIAEIE